jgi:hypothetical protein
VTLTIPLPGKQLLSRRRRKLVRKSNSCLSRFVNSFHD